MAVISVFLNLNKVFSLFLVFLEFCDIFTVSVAATLILIIWIVVNYIFPGLRKKEKPSAENEVEGSVGNAAVDLRTHLFCLKNLSRKFADERKRLMQTVSQDPSVLQKRCAEDLNHRQTSFLETMFETIEKINSGQNQRVEEVMRTLEEIKSDFSIVKRQIQQETFSGSCITFQPETTGNNRDQSEKPSDSEILNEIVMSSRECFLKLKNEARTKSKEIIRAISRHVEQTQKDIRRELSIFSSSVEVCGKDKNGASISLLVSKVEKTEKNLLDTFGVLNRQRFEMENLQKILNHFDGKFNFIITKFDTFWNQSQMAFSNAAQRLETIENRWTSVGEKIDNASRHLIHQSKKLTFITEDLQNVHKFRNHYGHFLSSVAESEGSNDVSPDNATESLVMNIDHFNQKFEDLFLTSENIKSKLISLTQSSNILESFHNLIKSVAEGYIGFLSFICPTVEVSNTVKERSDHKNRSRFSNNSSGGWRPQNNVNNKNDNPLDEYLEEDLLQELKCEFKDINVDEILFILKDLAKSTQNLTEYEKTKGTCAKGSDSDANVEGSDQWEDIPTETLLSEVSSNCLVQNSEESEY